METTVAQPTRLKPLWRYKEDDKSTWLYSGCKVYKKTNNDFHVTWIKNPDFAYSHLI